MNPAIRHAPYIVALLLLSLSTALYAQEKHIEPSQATLAKQAIQFTPADFKCSDAPRGMPAGTRVQILEENPAHSGLFTMRVKLPVQTTLMPHWHPQDERIIVLSGAVYVGFGNKADLGKARLFEAGSYYVNPARLYHYTYFGEETVIQLTAMGPWKSII